MTTDWEEILSEQKIKYTLEGIKKVLNEKKRDGQIIYPPEDQIFAALELTPFEKTKVVILGQDPYHRENQAHGLAFSVPQEQEKIPRSLANIFKELYDDVGIKNTKGCLIPWATQGVLLLNSILTVEYGKPKAHVSIRWDEITDHIISQTSYLKKEVIFVLWGKQAQAKRRLIDEDKNFVLCSTHPAPFSARKGFFGSKPFSKINKILADKNKTEIDWSN